MPVPQTWSSGGGSWRSTVETVTTAEASAGEIAFVPSRKGTHQKAERIWSLRHVVVCGVVTSVVAVIGPMSHAAWASAPSMSVDRSTGLLRGQQVTVTGTGFAPGVEAGVVECSTAAGQPTVQVAGFDIAVGCTDPFGSTQPLGGSNTSTSATGAFTTTFVVATGIVGPPLLGLDSAGRNSAADAADYPCPPTAAQQAAGATCVIRAGDSTGHAAATAITFGAAVTTSPAAGASPATGLGAGQVVDVTGTGFTPLSPGVVLECNVTPGEPTSSYPIPGLPVGCTNVYQQGSAPTPPLAPPPLNGSFLTTGTGGLDTTFAVREGNIGASSQSLNFPCPPTAANLTAGGGCTLVVYDGAGERVDVAITITGPVPVPTMRALPTSNLVAGQNVVVVGAGFVPLASGAIIECNNAPGQPTVPIDGFNAPVGCSGPYGGHETFLTTSPAGTVSGVYTVTTGVVGPSAPGTDSAGHDAAADAADYPCPPTAAQQHAGASCEILVGDLAGDAATAPINFAGAMPAPRNRTLVAMAPTAGRGGYWLAGVDGGVLCFGNATFYGSLPASGVHPSGPVVAMTATPDGGGYWLASSDGGVYAFGDATFRGSLPASRVHPAASVVAITATPDGGGYWLASSDGGVYAFGDATFRGSLPAIRIHPVAPVTGLAAAPDGAGYWMSGADGGLFAFGSAAPPGT